jgi:outer membrane protein TolC
MLQNVDRRENCRWWKAGRRAVWFAWAMGCSAAIGPVSAVAQGPGGGVAAGAPAAPVTITLEEAIRRAEASDPTYALASEASRSAALDRSIARAGLLPSARALSQDIYTQPNGAYSGGDAGQAKAPLPRFVANDSRPWEYMAQGIAEEAIGLAGAASVRKANAAAAQAAAELEIARRGLVAGVTVLFYSSLAADSKVTAAHQALQQASNFTKATQDREQAREAAHADVVKAQLDQQQRQRELADAQVAAEKAQLELGVLLFPDPRTPYTLIAPQAPPVLASREDVEAAAAKNNPELKSALEAVKASDADVMAARAAYTPNVLLNVTYGIDANQFAVNGPLNPPTPSDPNPTQARNLGYSTTFSVNLPVWDWLSTEHKVKQSEIRRQAAKVALTATQRQLIAKLDEDYSEARTARDQLASLDQSVDTAAESLRLTREAYTGGEATVLAVVDAENSYLLAENARADGRVRYEAALAQLQTLTGTM